MAEAIDQLKLEAARLHEDVLWAEKQHFAMATIWRRAHFLLGAPSALLATLAGVSALKSYPELAALLALGSVILTSLLTFLQPEKVAASHHSSGVAYNGIRGRLRRLRNIDAIDQARFEEMRAALEQLAQEKQATAKMARHVGGLAYKLARKSIERGEHSYEVDSN